MTRSWRAGAAVPASVRLRRAVRSFPPVRMASVASQVLTHPANRGRRRRALADACWWQLRSRVSRKPVDREVFGGLRLRCYPRSNAASRVIYFSERFDPAEMGVVEAWVAPGDAVIDAGANIGTYTLFLASLVGSGGRVVAVEPTPKIADRLCENVALSGLTNVRVVRAAVADTPGQAEITTGLDVSNTLTARPGTDRRVAVDVVTLDEVVPHAVTFIKLDVEGYEELALRGASRLLRGGPLIQAELSEPLLRRAGSSGGQVVALLESAGYRVGYPYLDGRRVALRDDRHGEDKNIVAVPAGRWDDLVTRLDRP